MRTLKSKTELIKKYQKDIPPNVLLISDKTFNGYIRHIKRIDDTHSVFYYNIKNIIYQVKNKLLLYNKELEYEIDSQFPVKLFFFANSKEIGLNVIDKLKTGLLKVNEIAPFKLPKAIKTKIGFFFVFTDYYFKNHIQMKWFVEECTKSLNSDVLCTLKHFPLVGTKNLTGIDIFDHFDPGIVEDFHLHYIKCNSIFLKKDKFHVFYY